MNAATGFIAPELLEKPILPTHLREVWAGFFSLSARRHYAYGMTGSFPQAITMEAIEGYCRHHEIFDFEEFHELLGLMDNDYLIYHQKKVPTS